MSWVRFDDVFPRHLKVAPLSDAAFRLHMSAICWSAENLTDGKIPVPLIRLVAPIRGHAKAAKELVMAGLWEIEEDGWLIHDYHDYQPSAQEVRARRQAAADKKKQQRMSRGDKGGDSPPDSPNPSGAPSPDPSPHVYASAPAPVPNGSYVGNSTHHATTTGNRLVEAFAKQHARTPPRKHLQQVGQQIDALLAEGVDPDDVWGGLQLLAERTNLGAGMLPSLVNEAMNAPRRRTPVLTPNRAEQRTQQGLALVAKLAAQERHQGEIA